MLGIHHSKEMRERMGRYKHLRCEQRKAKAKIKSGEWGFKDDKWLDELIDRLSKMGKKQWVKY